MLEELARLGRPRDQFEISISDRLDDQVKADPRGYVARMEEEGVDRVVLDIYPPFDLRGGGGGGEVVVRVGGSKGITLTLALSHQGRGDKTLLPTPLDSRYGAPSACLPRNDG